MSDDYGTIREDEYHPAADSAMVWIKWFIASDPLRWIQIKEAISSTALSGNRMAEICSETIRRLAENEGVSDRYLLGLAWFLRDNFERDSDEGLSRHSSVQRPRKRKKNTPKRSK